MLLGMPQDNAFNTVISMNDAHIKDRVPPRASMSAKKRQYDTLYSLEDAHQDESNFLSLGRILTREQHIKAVDTLLPFLEVFLTQRHAWRLKVNTSRLCLSMLSSATENWLDSISSPTAVHHTGMLTKIAEVCAKVVSKTGKSFNVYAAREITRVAFDKAFGLKPRYGPYVDDNNKYNPKASLTHGTPQILNVALFIRWVVLWYFSGSVEIADKSDGEVISIQITKRDGHATECTLEMREDYLDPDIYEPLVHCILEMGFRAVRDWYVTMDGPPSYHTLLFRLSTMAPSGQQKTKLLQL